MFAVFQVDRILGCVILWVYDYVRVQVVVGFSGMGLVCGKSVFENAG